MDDAMRAEFESCRELMTDVGLDGMWEVGAARLIRLVLSGVIEDPKLDAKVSTTLVTAAAAKAKTVGATRIGRPSHRSATAGLSVN